MLSFPPTQASRPTAESPAAAIPQQEATVSPTELAQRLWAEFDETTWEAPFEDWSKLHSNLSCKPFRGNMWGAGAERQWSRSCTSGPQPEAGRWSFYVFGLEGPLTPRLKQFDASTAMLPYETLTPIQNFLQNQLVTRFGPGEDRSPKVSAIRPPISWPQRLRWQTPDLEIQLNLSEFDPQRGTGRLQLQARHRTLLEAMKEDERLRLAVAASHQYDGASEIDKRLAEDLRADFPQAATFLIKDKPDPDPEKVREAVQQLQNQLRTAAQAAPQSQNRPRAAIIAMPALSPTHWRADEFHDALVKLLTSVKTSSREWQPVILLAADRLASRLPRIMTDDKSQAEHWPEWQKQLASLGVTYEESAMSPEESPWVYTGRLVERVWTDYGDTDWGERSFLALLTRGWDMGVDCAAGSDQFRSVIQKGPEFQKTHPNSPYLLEVQFLVAQAYETWWSLSQAPTGEETSELDVNVQSANYMEGAEAARQKAIALYEQFLQKAPQSDYAAYAQRVLPRLKLGIDTGQRRFFCFIDD